MPAGLTVDAGNGIISGTPTVDGVFKIGLSAANAGGNDKQTLVLTLLTEDEVENNRDSGAGSMRQLIINAAPGDILSIDPSLDGQTIILDGTALFIDKDLTIDASALSAGLTVSGNGTSRVFDIASGATVTMDSITITGGAISDDSGAGIRNNGTLILDHVTVSGNVLGGFGLWRWNPQFFFVVDQQLDAFRQRRA